MRCLKGELNAPGLAPLTAEEILFWFRNITIEDIEAVNREIEAEIPESLDHRSRVQSMLQKIRDMMRGGEGSQDGAVTKVDAEDSKAEKSDQPGD
ncbi:MAG TPA: hypothetical protein VFU86_08450 [Terriglobales bacterium]|nr:hypothetical protein [Terriglobales bacterium]